MRLTSRLRPNRSGWPRKSISAGRPAAPIATPTVPLRQARPKLSLMMTANRTPKRADSRARNASALASGSTGSNSARWTPSLGATLDWSTPAFAITKPSRCSTISRLGRARTTRRDSDSTISTSRGSLAMAAPSFSASADGVTPATSTARPSAFETIFCATTSTSPSRGRSRSVSSASPSSPARLSPACTIGKPGTACSSSDEDSIYGNPVAVSRTGRAGGA